MTSGWLAPALGFVVVNGLLGIVIKLALEEISWQDVLMWSALVYGVVGCALLVLNGGPDLGSTSGVALACATGICAAGGLLFAVFALETGDASRAVPVMSAFPLLTLGLAVLFLGERVSAIQVFGVALVVTGLIFVGRGG